MALAKSIFSRATPPSLPAATTVIGRSFLGREIQAWRVPAPNCRALSTDLDNQPFCIIAGQHGDEKLAVAAALSCIQQLSEQPSAHAACVWIIPCLNPDGFALGERLNAQGKDLNRDHLARATPEIQQLHRFIRDIQPRCVFDLHTFAARRRWMRVDHLEHAADVLVDWPTGPAAHLIPRAAAISIPEINHWLNQNSEHRLLAGRYWLRSNRGRIRHSTPDWLDLRNQVAAQYRIPTRLVEGREPLATEPQQEERTVTAMTETTLGMIARDQAEPATSQPPTCIPSQYRYRSVQPIHTVLRNRTTLALHQGSLAGKHSDHLEASQHIPVARKIWIPSHLSRLITHLHRLAAPLTEQTNEASPSPLDRPLQRLFVQSAQPTHHPQRNPRKVQVRVEHISKPNAKSFTLLTPTAAQRAYWTSLLDPRHKYNLTRLHQSELVTNLNRPYPLLFEY